MHKIFNFKKLKCFAVKMLQLSQSPGFYGLVSAKILLLLKKNT